MGLSLSVVFQLAHCVEEAEFPLPGRTPAGCDNSWAVHQVETTVDFARKSRVVSWLLGGLNFQIEHHLFPHDLPHQLPGHVEGGEADVPGVRGALRRAQTVGGGRRRRTYRWLRRMGVQGHAARERASGNVCRPPVMQLIRTGLTEAAWPEARRAHRGRVDDRYRPRDRPPLPGGRRPPGVGRTPTRGRCPGNNRTRNPASSRPRMPEGK